jgi:hypothetical protein
MFDYGNEMVRGRLRSKKKAKRVNRACLFGGGAKDASSFKKPPSPYNDVKYWNAFEYDRTIIAYVSNTDVDGYPTKYCIVRLDEKMVNIESSGDFEVWGHFPNNNLVQFRKLEDNSDTGVQPERIYILTAEQVKGIYAIVEAPTQQRTRNFNLPDLEIPLLSYLNENYVLKIINFK